MTLRPRIRIEACTYMQRILGLQRRVAVIDRRVSWGWDVHKYRSLCRRSEKKVLGERETVSTMTRESLSRSSRYPTVVGRVGVCGCNCKSSSAPQHRQNPCSCLYAIVSKNIVSEDRVREHPRRRTRFNPQVVGTVGNRVHFTFNFCPPPLSRVFASEHGGLYHQQVEFPLCSQAFNRWFCLSFMKLSSSCQLRNEHCPFAIGN